MTKVLPLIIALLLCPVVTHASSDYSISFEEFKKRLEGVFDEVQFSDLRSHLPEEFEIWGYDVGDFSSDEDPDVALSIRPKDLREKKVHVFFFVNDGKAFIEASRILVSYFEIPIEVGFTIEHGVCFMTNKEKDHHWFITGYTFLSGSFLLVDRFEVGRQALGPDQSEEIGYESYNNYLSLASSESFFNVANGKMFLKTLFYTLPAYRERRRLLPDFAADLRDTSEKYFLSGKELWKGANDLNFSTRAFYDDSSLTCFVNIVDDSLVVNQPDTSESDRAVFWIDAKGNRVNPSTGGAPNFRLQPDSNVMSISVSPGDFKAKRPRVSLVLRKDPSELQKKGIKGISVLSTKKANGYTLRVRLPFALFDFKKEPTSLGFTLEVIDVDGINSQSKKSCLATSQLREWDPSTFGVLRFISDRSAYGVVRNLAIENLLKRIEEVGI